MRHLNPHIDTLPQLSDVGFLRCKPTPCLQPYVQWYWNLTAGNSAYNPRSEYIHSDASAGLVLNWGSALAHGRGNYRNGVNWDAPHLQSQPLWLAGSLNSFGILFQPGALFTLFGIPASQLHDDSCLAELPLDVSLLYNEMGKAFTFAQRAFIAEELLISKLPNLAAASPVVARGITIIKKSKGCLKVEDLAQQLNLGRRQLERQFQQHLGVTAKQLAGRERVHFGRQLIKARTHQSLAEIAFEAGYADQAHFTKSFSRHIGITPQQYLARLT